MIVHVVIADYGLNGAGCEGVYATKAEAEKVAANPPREVTRVTGYGGCEVETWTVGP
jgi:hypothetical protein